jgi:outer membrane receptor protein involved in Fe transport
MSVRASAFRGVALWGLSFVSIVTLCLPALAQETAQRRQIEEVVVTAERRESTVQDTSMSITAFTSQFIEDFGLRNQEDLQAYIPATTVQPYDIAIRGVGRLFRALGGDPGVATYFNGAYSEDFGIASTEGGLYDIERIEVLRGPQGTLYGRNGVGGAVNFISGRPTQEFQGEVRGVFGSEGTQEVYGILSGPIVRDLVAARLTGVHRDRDGTIKNIGQGPDLDDFGDRNIALALKITPTNNFTINIRGNDRDYDRVMPSAQGAGAIVVSEFGGRPDPITGASRNTTQQVWGFRPVDPSVPCASLADRSLPTCTVAGQPVFEFSHGGITRNAQFVTPGVDMVDSGFARPNWAFGHDTSLIERSTIGDGSKLPRLDGSDLIVDQNGLNHEGFEHRAVYADMTWDISDQLTIKYIGAYTDYWYERITDDDRTSNDPLDMQFFAGQENENYQNELQFFFDFTPHLNLTAGLFQYHAQIDQRLDFWSQNLPRFTQPADYGTVSTAGLLPMMLTHRTARAWAREGIPAPFQPFFPEAFGLSEDGKCNFSGAATILGLGSQFGGNRIVTSCALSGLWLGEGTDPLNRTPSGPTTAGTSFIWNTSNRTDAVAVYAQSEWQFHEQLSLTLGARWARDERQAEESLFLYNEDPVPLLQQGISLLEYNASTGALNPDGTPTAGGLDETVPIRFRGRPRSQSIYRAIENNFEELTWRVNLDWTPDPSTLVYASVTKGYRAGGFNLGYFSVTPTYDSETLIAYELGYKGLLLDRRLQLNGSVFYYDYNDIHVQIDVTNFALGGTNTSVRNVPDARNIGVEAELMWLATEAITIGANYSHTDTEYGSEVQDGGIVNNENPNAPSSVFTSAQLTQGIKGEKLLRVPRNKASGWFMYALHMGDRGRVDFLTSVSWQDKVVWRQAGGPLNTSPDFARWDGRVTWTSTDSRWSVSGWVNNILDEVGIRTIDTETEAQGFMRTVTPNLPRIGGIDVRYRLGQ